ncbi:MAG: sigma-54-dependent Fis family transcriptional regulator [Planctomycetaceae bacterium]|nr:sigma-54-dependent Fis family transcriptional regulator [Planctomycetaceae bacterium]
MNDLRRGMLGLLGVAALAYVVALVWHLQTGSELGIDGLMSRAEPADAGPGLLIDRVALLPELDVVGVPPQPGDRLLQVGGAKVDSVLRFKRELKQLAEESRDPRRVVPRVKDPVELGALEARLARVDQEWWVPVVSRPGEMPAATDEGERSTWLRLRPPPRSGLTLSGVWILLATALLGLALIVVARRPGDPSASIFYVFCAASIVTFLGLFHWSSLVGTPWLVYPLVVCGVLLGPLLLHLNLLFPRPLSVVRRWPALTLATVYLPALVLLGTIVWQLAGVERVYGEHLADESVATDAVAARLQGLMRSLDAALALALLCHLAALGLLLVRARSGQRGLQQVQVRWLLGGMLATLPPIAGLLYLGLTDRAAFAYGGTARWLVGLTWLVLVTTQALGLSRYKLVSPGRLAIRALWYLGISATATLLYCGLVELLAPVAGRGHFHWLDAVAAALTALTVVLVLGWFRDRFQRGWERRYVVYKHQLDKAVRRLSEAVDHLVESSQMARQMLQSARDVVAAERGAVYLLNPQESRLTLAARVGWAAAPESLHRGSPLTHELHHTGVVSARAGLTALPTAAQLELRDLDAELAFALERDGLLVGLLVLGPKTDGSPYSGEERSFLAALARTTTLALRSAEENRTIDSLKEDLHAKISKIAEQQQRITFLQGQLLKRSPTPRHAQQAVAEPAPGDDAVASEIRGSSPAVREMLAQVRKIAASPSSVLIRGESGTGKELLAQAIHRNSPRAAGPFVAVHCAALSPGLLEAELFGHVKGAFTGADRDRPGRFELAHGGTLLLDEVGDIALDTQIKLLRVLQERAFEPVGSSHRVQVDVRLIAATHQDLESLIRRGRFREDLFYRLNVISVRCPPLRERRDDIFELAVGFLERYAQRAGKHLERIDEEALDALVAYDWPGNVRELENTIERAVVLAEGESITRRDLPGELLAPRYPARRGQREEPGDNRHAMLRTPRAADWQPAVAPPLDADAHLAGELAMIERQRLLEVLAECNGNKSRAAKKLGIPRSTLFSKLARLGLAAPR